MSEASNEARLSRQEQIWAGLYGPPQARELIEQARAQLVDNPQAEVDAILKALEPNDDIDADEAGMMRPS